MRTVFRELESHEKPNHRLGDQVWFGGTKFNQSWSLTVSDGTKTVEELRAEARPNFNDLRYRRPISC